MGLSKSGGPEKGGGGRKTARTQRAKPTSAKSTAGPSTRKAAAGRVVEQAKRTAKTRKAGAKAT